MMLFHLKTNNVTIDRILRAMDAYRHEGLK